MRGKFQIWVLPPTPDRFAVSPDTRLSPEALWLARGLRVGLARAGGFLTQGFPSRFTGEGDHP